MLFRKTLFVMAYRVKRIPPAVFGHSQIDTILVFPRKKLEMGTHIFLTVGCGESLAGDFTDYRNILNPGLTLAEYFGNKDCKLSICTMVLTMCKIRNDIQDMYNISRCCEKCSAHHRSNSIE